MLVPMLARIEARLTLDCFRILVGLPPDFRNIHTVLKLHAIDGADSCTIKAGLRLYPSEITVRWV